MAPPANVVGEETAARATATTSVTPPYRHQPRTVATPEDTLYNLGIYLQSGQITITCGIDTCMYVQADDRITPF
jgi:hypothetical protein